MHLEFGATQKPAVMQSLKHSHPYERGSGASCHARTHSAPRSAQHREHVGLRPGGCALRALPNDAE